jgi:hypothetical protein
MKAPPKKSALDGEVTASQSTEIANEILNEMQRSRGGDTVAEDESRYQVRLRRPGDKEGWSGEVVGPPTFFPLQSVNVLAFNKGILVFDKNNRLMWKGLLNYNVSGDPSSLDGMVIRQVWVSSRPRPAAARLAIALRDALLEAANASRAAVRMRSRLVRASFLDGLWFTGGVMVRPFGVMGRSGKTEGSPVCWLRSGGVSVLL